MSLTLMRLLYTSLMPRFLIEEGSEHKTRAWDEATSYLRICITSLCMAVLILASSSFLILIWILAVQMPSVL